MSGWWRLFVVFAVFCAGVAALWTVRARLADERVRTQLQATHVQIMCDPVDQGTASAKQREDCKSAREETVESLLSPWWVYVEFFLVIWAIPLAILLALAAIGRWVARGFSRSAAPG